MLFFFFQFYHSITEEAKCVYHLFLHWRVALALWTRVLRESYVSWDISADCVQGTVFWREKEWVDVGSFGWRGRKEFSPLLGG